MIFLVLCIDYIMRVFLYLNTLVGHAMAVSGFGDSGETAYFKAKVP